MDIAATCGPRVGLSMAALNPKIRTLLVLGRVSNLPTVWSNCLAAWMLNGGGGAANFFVLILGGTLLYVGGMFLNDACDAAFDREHRRERPIPAGKVSARAVWGGGVVLLVSGCLALALLGLGPAVLGLALCGAIVLYDVVHKRVAFAPLLMAACRFLLYLVAAAATQRPVGEAVVIHALALAGYITGLSYVARRESASSAMRLWPLGLLAAPVLAGVLVNSHRDALSWAVMLLLVLWAMWWLRRLRAGAIGPCVAGLLAGIVLVDWAAIPHAGAMLAAAFAGLFLLALLMQRRIPAT